MTTQSCTSSEEAKVERPTQDRFVFSHSTRTRNSTSHLKTTHRRPRRSATSWHFPRVRSARVPRTVRARSVCSPPRSFGDVTVIADALRARQVVIVNLQGVDRALLQRVVDFTSGVAYTLDGKIQKLADAMYLVVPPGTPVNSDGIKETLAADPSFDFMTRG